MKKIKPLSRKIIKRIKRPRAAGQQERLPALADRYAHRGFYRRPDIPENSMPAFRRAAEHGFPVEFDVHLIADGSLVVFHDEALMRQTGAEGVIEDLTLPELKELRLEGTDEQIPEFDEVLDLFEDTGLPLLIELKSAGGNHRELAEAACRRLDSYKGEFVIESFDPRVLMALKKLRPEFIRGQLVQNFIRNREGLPLYQAALLTSLIFNKAVKPDFIAYRFADRGTRTLKRAAERRGMGKAAWTIRTPEDYRAAVREGCTPIFEHFDPDSDTDGQE